jgi:Zn-dependent oligopeptidase
MVKFVLSAVYADVDFLEAPSQMLENWVWDKDSLKLMSCHYKDGTAIDDKLLDDLIRSKKEMAGQLFLRPFKIS